MTYRYGKCLLCSRLIKVKERRMVFFSKGTLYRHLRDIPGGSVCNGSGDIEWLPSEGPVFQVNR